MEQLRVAERLKIQRARMPSLGVSERTATFAEVNCGLRLDQAVTEATRCLQCRRASCVDGCPVGVDIPAFVDAVAQGNLARAAAILYESNVLPAITGRVCPQETQCEVKCSLGKKHQPVAIGHLERFVADWARDNHTRTLVPTRSSGYRVAVVGSGPAGLTCAGELARRGHGVTIFEALHRPGGVLVYGIPEFRLPKTIVEREVDSLRRLGVRLEFNVVIGQTLTIQDLLSPEGYDAVFIANGAGLPRFQGIDGEHLKGVYSANEYLTRVNLMGAYRGGNADTPLLRGERVVVVGGGNTAMDAVRTARRLGADPAVLVYRRSEEEMPARLEEVMHAREEGVDFQMLTNPVALLGSEDGWVSAVRCQRMELGPSDDSGRRRPVPIEGSETEIPCEVFVEAIGTLANPLLTRATPEIEVDGWGNIKVDASGRTSLPRVYAGGDIVRGGATVILAMGDGKNVASSIHRLLMGE